MKFKKQLILGFVLTFSLSGCLNNKSNKDPDEGKYNLTFYFDNGQEKQTYKLSPGDTIAYPEAYKEGYEFTGWKNNAFTGGIYETMPDKILAYTAQYRLITHEVEFYIENKVLKTVTCSIENPLQLPNYDKNGYVFEGWYLDNEYQISYETYVTLPETKTRLYGKLSEDRRNYTLHLNGGVAASFVTMTYDYCMENIKPIVREIYYGSSIFHTPELEGSLSFAGWYLDKEYTQRYVFDKEVTEGFTLYAKWNYFPSTSSLNTLFLNPNVLNKMNMDGTGSHNDTFDYKYYLFQVKKDGYYTIQYGHLSRTQIASSDSKDTVKFNITNSTTGKTILEDGSAASTSMSNIGFNAKEGDLIYIRMNQNIYNRGCYARVQINTENTKYPDTSKAIKTTSEDIQGYYLYNYSYSLPMNIFKEGYTFEGWTFNDEIVPSSGQFKFENNSQFYAKWSENK